MEHDVDSSASVTDIEARETRYQLFRLLNRATRFASTLRRFSLRGAKRDDGALFQLPSAAKNLCQSCWRLEQLELPGSNVLTRDSVFLEFIPHATSLLLLDVSRTTVSDAGVCLALTSCLKLIVLNIRDTPNLTEKTGAALCTVGLPLRRVYVDPASRIGVARVREAKKNFLTVVVV